MNSRKLRSLVQTSIDDLPEEILLHIISFLPTPTAVKTSAISRSWRNRWNSVPVLHFDMNEFINCMPPTERSSHQLRRLFVDHVNQTLYHCPPKNPLRVFKLDFYYLDNDYFSSCVDSWLRFALSCKPMELHLWLRVDHSFSWNDDYEDDEEEADDDDVFSSYYLFRSSNLVTSSVEVLSLSGCHISCPCVLLLSSIREMHLNIFVGDIENLIASCVNLEVLTLKGGFHLPSLTIVSPKLKHCNLQDLTGGDTEMISLEIHAPNLESIHIAYVEARKYVFTSAPALAKAHVCNLEWWDINVLSFISGVERLNIQNKWTWAKYTLQSGEAVFLESLAFNKLKHLELLTGYLKDDLLGLEILLNNCPLLVTLVFVSELHFLKGEEYEITDRPFALHMPRLRLVEMRKYRGTKNELYVVELLKKHGPVLEKIVAYPGGGYDAPPGTPFVL